MGTIKTMQLHRFVFAVLATAVLNAAQLQWAELGDLQLDSGQLIQDCRVAYRTYGQLNADRSNAILWPTWFGGTTEDLERLIGPGRLLDPTGYFLITVDALGNGVSSSPSNSRRQPGQAFPRFTIADMVRSQYELVTKKLGLKQLHAVVGISMGGMQAFEWVVAYPEFVRKAVPIVGTPQQTAYDLLLWRTELEILEQTTRCATSPAEAMKLVALVHRLALSTPDHFVRSVAVEQFPEQLTMLQAQYSRRNPDDWAAQLRAMIQHDITRRFGGSWEKTAAAIRAQLLVVVAMQDHMVNPQPSIKLAELLKARLLKLESDCGHLATNCEQSRIAQALAEFLRQ